MGERGDVIEIPRTGEKFIFLKRSRDTQGEVFEIEFFVREFALVAARPHIHATGEERVELIAGKARMRRGREEKIVGPGDAVVIPAGMAHSLRREGKEFLHFRMQMRPAMKTETMFETLIGLHRDGKNLTNLLQQMVLASEHSGYLGGPPIWLQKPAIAVGAAIGRLFGYRAQYAKYSWPQGQAFAFEAPAPFLALEAEPTRCGGEGEARAPTRSSERARAARRFDELSATLREPQGERKGRRFDELSASGIALRLWNSPDLLH